MNKERIIFPLSSRIFLARAFVLDEINEFEGILRERKGNNLKCGSVDEFIESEIGERRKALTDERSLFDYLLGRYCFCLRLLNEKDFSVFSEEEIRDGVDFLSQLLFRLREIPSSLDKGLKRRNFRFGGFQLRRSVIKDFLITKSWSFNLTAKDFFASF